MLVGEQPGNEEDLAGRPFVGPAGHLLSTALEEAGLDRDRIYVTNVVKHFKWEPRGKRRIHAKPNAGEIGACRLWFESEIVRERSEESAGEALNESRAGPNFMTRPTRLRDPTSDLPASCSSFRSRAYLETERRSDIPLPEVQLAKLEIESVARV